MLYINFLPGLNFTINWLMFNSTFLCQVLGSQPNAAEGEFYLDMANWNLQEAVSAWMDVHHPRNNPLAMRFVQVSMLFISILYL